MIGYLARQWGVMWGLMVHLVPLFSDFSCSGPFWWFFYTKCFFFQPQPLMLLAYDCMIKHESLPLYVPPVELRWKLKIGSSFLYCYRLVMIFLSFPIKQKVMQWGYKDIFNGKFHACDYKEQIELLFGLNEVFCLKKVNGVSSPFALWFVLLWSLYIVFLYIIPLSHPLPLRSLQF